MLLLPSKSDVEFTWYMKDDHTISISRLVVYSERRKGRGRQLFETWERSIPPHITKIELWSKNETATAFWTAMGFTDDYGLNNEDGSCCMSKLVITQIAGI